MLPAFPQFAPLTLEDKDAYDKLVADYPPISDISFATLHIWWNIEGKLSVSILNGNLVIHYYQPFDAENSGYSLIGKNQVEASVHTMLDHLRSTHKEVKLVHVPEFVIKELPYPYPFGLQEEIDYNEYIMDSRGLSSLQGALYKRTREEVNRFLREVEGRNVEVRELDVSTPEARKQLFDAVLAWEHTTNAANDPEHTEHEALQRALEYGPQLGMRYLGLYIDGKLHAMVLYHQPKGSNYYIMNHLKVDYSIPHIFNYMTHCLADKGLGENVDFLNMEMDLGLESLRMHKMRLRPVDFFRKYTVRPL